MCQVSAQTQAKIIIITFIFSYLRSVTFIYVNFMYWLDYFIEGHRVISCT